MEIKKVSLTWNEPLTPLDPSHIDGLALHHMADPTKSFLDIHAMHLAKVENGSRWKGIGYGYWVGFDGTIYEGRGLNVNAGVSEHNGHLISVGFQGDYENVNTEMPAAQYNAGVWLIAYLKDKLPNVRTVDGHKHWMPTACPGQHFPLEDMIAGRSRDQAVPAVTSAPVQPSAPAAPTGFSYPNNARVVGDDLYIRDAEGNRIPGRYVANGDPITVLDVSYTKQLALVEYPTPAGVRSGYVKNVPSLIQYYNQGQWHNGSTPETVYGEDGTAIGRLDPREEASPLYRKNGRLHVVYNTISKGANTKSGYVAYNGGFTKF